MLQVRQCDCDHRDRIWDPSLLVCRRCTGATTEGGISPPPVRKGIPGENVNHPEHYNMGRFEVIDVIEDWRLGYNDGNAVKYISRHMYKGKPIEDLEKAKWCIERRIQELERQGVGRSNKPADE